MKTTINPLVSVIVNCHNGEKYLEHSIKSIINQSYKNWEIIFWDNISSDNSNVIIKNFNDERIRCFKSDTFTNLYEARNLAIKKAEGVYVCFLDVDDFWTEDKLEHQIKFMEKNKEYDIQYSNYYVQEEIKKKKYLKFNKKLKSGNITQELLNKYTIGILTVILKKSIFKNYLFDKRYNIIGDFDYFTKLSVKYKIAYIEKPLAVYRVHQNNYSSIHLHEFESELDLWIKKNELSLKSKNFSLFQQKFYLFKLKIRLFLKANLGVWFSGRTLR